MSPIALSAALSACLAVFACWEGLMLIERVRLIEWLRRVLVPLRRAGKEGRVPTRPEQRRLVLLLVLILLAAGWLVGSPLLGLLLGLSAPAIVISVLRVRQYRYRLALRRGAPELARTLADALRAGYSIRGGIAEAARGLSGAVGHELRRSQAALEVGETTDVVLERLSERAGCTEFDTLVAAVLLQRDAGGDLSTLLSEIALTLEDSVRLRRDATTATTQARFTAYLVISLPLVATALIELASPGYLAGLLANTLSLVLLLSGFVVQLLGVFAVRRVARVKL